MERNDEMNIFERIVLFGVFLLLCVSCWVVLVFAFQDHRLALERLEQIVVTAHASPSLVTADGKDVSAGTKSALSQLDAEQKKAFDSNTLSFLFQIFAVSIVAVAGYLLVQSRQNVDAAQSAQRIATDAANSIGPFIRNVGDISAIAALIAGARQSVDRLCEADHDQIGSLMPDARDAFNFLDRRLERAIHAHAGIENSLFEYFVDELVKMANKLEVYSRHLLDSTDSELVLTMKGMCQTCLDHLRSYDFAKTYEHLATALQSHRR